MHALTCTHKHSGLNVPLLLFVAIGAATLIRRKQTQQHKGYQVTESNGERNHPGSITERVLFFFCPVEIKVFGLLYAVGINGALTPLCPYQIQTRLQAQLLCPGGYVVIAVNCMGPCRIKSCGCECMGEYVHRAKALQAPFAFSNRLMIMVLCQWLTKTLSSVKLDI